MIERAPADDAGLNPSRDQLRDMTDKPEDHEFSEGQGFDEPYEGFDLDPPELEVDTDQVDALGQVPEVRPRAAGDVKHPAVHVAEPVAAVAAEDEPVDPLEPARPVGVLGVRRPDLRRRQRPIGHPVAVGRLLLAVGSCPLSVFWCRHRIV